jgi:hypothetical protein
MGLVNLTNRRLDEQQRRVGDAVKSTLRHLPKTRYQTKARYLIEP